MWISGDSVLEAIQNLTLENQALRAEIAANRKTVEEAEAIIEAAIPPVGLLEMKCVEDYREMRTIVKAVWPAQSYQLAIDALAVAQAGPDLAERVAERFMRAFGETVYQRLGLRR